MPLFRRREPQKQDDQMPPLWVRAQWIDLLMKALPAAMAEAAGAIYASIKSRYQADEEWLEHIAVAVVFRLLADQPTQLPREFVLANERIVEVEAQAVKQNQVLADFMGMAVRERCVLLSLINSLDPKNRDAVLRDLGVSDWATAWWATSESLERYGLPSVGPVQAPEAFFQRVIQRVDKLF